RAHQQHSTQHGRNVGILDGILDHLYVPSPSIHDAMYSGFSNSSASTVRLSGWKASTITANSSVCFAPIEASVAPGCGPWARPDGWSAMSYWSMPLRGLTWPAQQ